MTRKAHGRTRSSRFRSLLPVAALMATTLLGGCYYPGYGRDHRPVYRSDHDGGQYRQHDDRRGDNQGWNDNHPENH